MNICQSSRIKNAYEGEWGMGVNGCKQHRKGNG
jgi:hypothetical protein